MGNLAAIDWLSIAPILAIIILLAILLQWARNNWTDKASLPPTAAVLGEEDAEAISDEQLEETLGRWAYAAKFLIGPSQTMQGDSFSFVLHMPYVVRVFDTPGRINTQILWTVGTTSYGAGITELSDQQRIELSENLTMELGRHSVDLAIQDNLRAIALNSHLRNDHTLTSYTFIEHLGALRCARESMQVVVAQYLRMAPPTFDSKDSPSQ